MNRYLLTLLLSLSVLAATAAEPADSAAADTVPRRNFIQKVIAYFGEANKVRDRNKFDISVVGGPHYSSDSKFGLGVLAAGTYNLDREIGRASCRERV